MKEEKIIEVLKKLKEENKKRNFEQSVDMIINLKNFDPKKESVNVIITLPHAIKKPKVLAFLNKKSSVIDTITKEEFDKYKDKKDIKKLVKKYDFFIAHASLMPLIATKFGKYLGPAGKMPSPQLGILREEKDEEIKKLISSLERVVKVKSKEPSLKFCIGKESMKEEELAENISNAYETIVNALPRKEQQIKNVMIKFTMSKPIKIEL